MIIGALAIHSMHASSLHGEELALVAHARDQRLTEFATGRALLRQLLMTSAPIVRASNGAPEWPQGVVGSLAHDQTNAVAAIGPTDRYRAIGIDIEHHEHGNGESDDELRESVLRADDPDIDPITAFVVKEAAYKAWSQLGGEIIGPLAVHIHIDGNKFTAEMPDETAIGGNFVDTGDSWLAVAVVYQVLGTSSSEEEFLEVPLRLCG